MTFIPHISVTTKPGHDDASVKVSFVKEVIAASRTNPLGDLSEANNTYGTISDERDVGELAEVSADTAHEVAKLLHRTLEMDAELRGEHAKTEAQEMESYLGKKEGLEDQIDDLHEQLASATAEPHDLEAHLADHRALIEQQRKEINWYRGVADLLSTTKWQLCPRCRAEYPCDGCSTCGGAGFMEIIDTHTGAMEKLSAAKIAELKQKRDAGVTIVVGPWTRRGAIDEVLDDMKTVEEGLLKGMVWVDTSGIRPAEGDSGGDLTEFYVRLTDRSRRIIEKATNFAKVKRSIYVDIYYLLHAIYSLNDTGIACTALRNCGVDLAKAAESLNGDIQAESPIAADIPEIASLYSQQAKAALLFSAQEATRLGHPYIGSEHILLGLLSQGASDAVWTADAVRKEIYSLLGVESPK